MRVVRPSSHQRNAMEAMLFPMNTTATNAATMRMSVGRSVVPSTSEIVASGPLSGMPEVMSWVSGIIAATPSMSSPASTIDAAMVPNTHRAGSAPAMSSIIRSCGIRARSRCACAILLLRTARARNPGRVGLPES